MKFHCPWVRLGLLLCVVSSARAVSPEADTIIRNGMIYDGSGHAPYKGDIAIRNGRIAAIGTLTDQKAAVEIDAAGMAVTPGFINMMSWANETLIHDGRSRSDICQGVTLEVLGEGTSMGPLNEAMKKTRNPEDAASQYAIEWTTLGEFLDWLARRGVSPNIASFVGATTVRTHVLGYESRPPNPEELDRMRKLVSQAMEEGAVGLSSALQYHPAFYATTDELVALAEVAARYDSIYISHIRSEGNQLLESIDELIAISRRARCRAEIYHLKASGRKNWPKMKEAIAKIEAARAEGLAITADVYPYAASSTGLSTILPEWFQEGGPGIWVPRLKDPAYRERLLKEVRMPTLESDEGATTGTPPEHILLVGFRNPSLKPLIGKTLAEVAKSRGTPPVDTALDLLYEDKGRINAVYFSMAEDNLRREIQMPWVSFCSDAGSYSSETNANSTHPRAYGAFARVLAKFVREDKLIPLEEAVRRMTSLPAGNLKLDHRGRLAVEYHADVVILAPDKIQDHATFEQPRQFATGVRDVFVNGIAVIRNGEHTGAKPGQVVRGPGWKKGKSTTRP